ncbi:NAD-dependent epimerase/dehydratase family protein [Marinisporobacter balticus]|uniref:Nucleoside-diphosphate-sugar epimerase n=1 Tax=Marinisporobacter balticus TaxID=2018667 RepID=A0A4R2KBD7_9FIRM|nr:NAD(P)-dependent oxidoreductase [Marinisporobacter balticus]TCO69357.1 nucleoside-diphosphate-sugar epimerase [Marinisporobacter balticus]
MNVLVTGATGFLGQKLAIRLKHMGYKVTGIGRNKIKGEMLKNYGIEFVSLDLGNKEQTVAVCKEKDYIFHCAALSSPWGKYEAFYKSNVLSTKNLIFGSKKTNIKRLIHVSTPSIYFDYKDKMNISEDSVLPQNPVNYYAQTKLLAENEINQAFKEGLSLVTIRPRALFGPGDTTILPRLIRANNKGSIPLINGGKAIIDTTYVENVVDALILCMNGSKDTLGKKYNITNDEPMALIDLLNKLFDKLDIHLKTKNISFHMAYRLAMVMEWISKYILKGKEPILTRYSVGVLSKNQTLDIENAKNDLGYIPKVGVDEGLDLFVEWLKGDGSWILS